MEAAEEEGEGNYGGRRARPGCGPGALGTDAGQAVSGGGPWLVVCSSAPARKGRKGKRNNYYVTESVGLATGLFLTAAHQAGLATLTHTPSPMNGPGRAAGATGQRAAFLLILVEAIRRRNAGA